MAQARGGFFGKIFGGLGKVFGPIVSGIGNAVSGIFGGAKKKATQVAHQAIGHAKNAAVQAIQTGDVRGAARSLQSNLMTTKKEAMTHANAEFERGKAMARAAATKRIEAAHAQYRQKAQSQYNSGRSHSGWQQYGYGRPRSQSVRRRSPPRRRSPARRRSPERGRRSSYPRRQVPSYDEFYGAGFGKKHFKRLEREAHRHINRIYSHAKKQVGESYKHIRKNGKKGIGQAKKQATKSINKVHKEGAGVFKGHLAAVKALMREDIQKKKMGLVKKRKGAGIKVGAGTKVGAGGMIDPRLDPKGAEEQSRYGKFGKRHWEQKKARGKGISVGAGVPRRRRRKRKSSPEEEY